MPHTHFPPYDPRTTDVVRLRVSRYHLQYPTPMTLSEDPLLWKTLIADLYNQITDKMRVAQTLEKEKKESLYRVCATNDRHPYIPSDWSREDFCGWFTVSDEDAHRTSDLDYDRYVSQFLRHEFRKSDINRRYSIARRGRGGGLPLGFPQMLVELCSDTLELVDFMEISARIPFTSDLNRLLRNFCYHVLVKGSISREVWERHAMTIYNAYRHLLDHLNSLPHRYGVIRTFLHTPEFNEENVEVVIKSFLMSGAWLNFVLRETGSHQAVRKVVKCVKEAVEAVDACKRPGRFYSDYSKAVIKSGICDKLMSGIRIVLQVQCICEVQIRSGSRMRGSNLSIASFEAYKDLAKEGRRVLALGRREKIEKWMVKVHMKHSSEGADLME